MKRCCVFITLMKQLYIVHSVALAYFSSSSFHHSSLTGTMCISLKNEKHSADSCHFHTSSLLSCCPCLSSRLLVPWSQSRHLLQCYFSAFKKNKLSTYHLFFILPLVLHFFVLHRSNILLMSYLNLGACVISLHHCHEYMCIHTHTCLFPLQIHFQILI